MLNVLQHNFKKQEMIELFQLLITVCFLFFNPKDVYATLQCQQYTTLAKNAWLISSGAWSVYPWSDISFSMVSAVVITDN